MLSLSANDTLLSGFFVAVPVLSAPVYNSTELAFQDISTPRVFSDSDPSRVVGLTSLGNDHIDLSSLIAGTTYQDLVIELMLVFAFAESRVRLSIAPVIHRVGAPDTAKCQLVSGLDSSTLTCMTNSVKNR